MGGLAKHRFDADPPQGPASGTILKKTRRRKTRGRTLPSGAKFEGTTLKSGFSATFEVNTPLRYNFDQRFLVNFVSLRLAQHYAAQLKRGMRADGYGRLPKVKDRTLSNDMLEGRRGDWVGMRSGWMADHWWVGVIGGSSLKAHRLIKPNGSDGGERPDRKSSLSDKGRGDVINKLLDRPTPVDFQSVRGAAARVIQKAVDECLPLMVGHKLGVPANVDRSAGTIDRKEIP